MRINVAAPNSSTTVSVVHRYSRGQPKP
jgi:hypothetical protein